MKINYLFTVVFSLIFLTASYAQRNAEPGVLGAGLSSSYPVFGISGKYNFTEHHSTQLILGGATYGYDSTGFSFGASGRYLYNFNVLGDRFFFKPYAYAQVSFLTVTSDFVFAESETFSTVAFGLGGGVEFEVPEFVEGLAVSAELGYVGGSFDTNIYSSFAGVAFGAGIHYYFDF